MTEVGRRWFGRTKKVQQTLTKEDFTEEVMPELSFEEKWE